VRRARSRGADEWLLIRVDRDADQAWHIDSALAPQPGEHDAVPMKAMRTIRMIALVVLAGMSVAPSAGASEPNGRVLYLQFCFTCHGAEGRGDGPDANILASPPRDLREGFLKKYTTDDLVRRVRAGRTLELALDLPALRARANDVEDIVAHLKRLPAVDWSLVEPGWSLYLDRCMLCHGLWGKPGASLPPGVRTPRDLGDPAFQRATGDTAIVCSVRHGCKGMPALTPRVPESVGPMLVAFVRLLSPGFELYSHYCAACHGDDGRGTRDLGEVPGMPSVIFDRAYFSHRDPEQLRESVWHMIAEQKPTMPHFRRQLTEAQARSIIEYLKQP
jgi:mono/diheme cytochrome c family protein